MEKLKTLPQLQDLATDQQTGGAATRLVIDRPDRFQVGDYTPGD